jgi:hypothetical protein
LRERALVRVGGVLLVAQEHHLVPEQRGAQFRHRGRIDGAAGPDAADDGADDATDLGDGDLLVGRLAAESHRSVLDAGHARAPFRRRSFQHPAPPGLPMSSITIGLV